MGNVINALTDGHSKHIPYRSSTLTRILQDSLGGNSKTSLIVTCSPSYYNLLETASTLRFGQRAKCIKNTPKVNKEHTVEELIKLLEESEASKAILKGRVIYLEKLLTESGIPFDHDGRALPEELSMADTFGLIRDANLNLIVDRETRETQTDEDYLAKRLRDLEDRNTQTAELYESLKVDYQLLKVEAEENEKVVEFLKENLERIVLDQLNQKESFEKKVILHLLKVGDLASQINEANSQARPLEQMWELK